ncbi:hypothetical protein [Bradyrhizobium sp. RT10b]|uniref:hypothetical protein n=1 Tax=Bradyrhizobium sp. RT10b TaxID=3156331 RepID=UPI003393A2AC
MAENSPFFTFVIRKRTGSFGEVAHQESDEVARLLTAAAQAIRSGTAIDNPEQRQLKCRSGHVVAEFHFGEGMIRGPGAGFDQTDYRMPSAFELANQARR